MAKSKTEKKDKGNFWGGEPVATLPKATKTKREPRKLEWGWLILGVVLIAVIVLAVVFNAKVEDKSAEKIMKTVAVDNSDLKVNWERYKTVEVELTESLTISESGTYRLTGNLRDGNIVVDAGVGEVRLILDNVSIANSAGPAIVCYNAENLVIELVGESNLTDGATYASDYDEDVDGVIYSKADLAFTGEGSLNVTANHADAIVGKDDVVIRDGIYSIAAVDDGIRGKDSVYVTDGDFTIAVKGDAIKSTNDTDYGKGFVMLEDGGFIVTTEAGKGLSAAKTILVYGGELELNTYDDAIHSNNYVGIVDGDVVINAGDDGVHADNELIVDGGDVDVVKAYEGMEAQVVTINGGKISIFSTDDGINAGGGADNSNSQSAQGRKDIFKTDENCVLSVNGGDLYINAAGDGVDSNGYIYFNGGSTVVDGPTNNGNGALDSGLGISIQGGTVIAVGSSGMAETLGTNSGICNISVFFSTTQEAGTLVEVRSSNGEVTLSHMAAKKFSHLAAGSEALLPGETYTIYLNNVEYESFTISEVTTVIGNSSVNQFNMPGQSGQK